MDETQYATIAEVITDLVPRRYLTPDAYATAVCLRLIALINSGHTVEPQEIAGLWRIDGGPEITTGQLLNITLPPTQSRS